jgi:citrate lyase subunit alpha/citrate CoA-transferase
MTERAELVQNAAGRMVPAMVNGKPQIPYLGVAKYQPRGRKTAPPVRSSKDYSDDGDKRVPDLETALRKCGLRDGMVISNHHHLRDGDRVALMMLEAAAKSGGQRLALVSQRVVSFTKGRHRFDAVGRDPSH